MPLEWQSSYPAWIRRRQTGPALLPHLTLDFAAARGVQAQVTFCFPDDIPPKKGIRTALQQATAWVPQGSVLPPAVTTWYPRYADLIVRPKRLIPQQDFPPPQDFPVIVSLFRWHPIYPDWIASRRLQPSSMQVSVLAGHPTLPVLVEWLPKYPDLHWTTGLKAPWHQTFVQNLDPIPNPPSPELAWGPSYPDQVWPLVRLKPPLQQAAANDPRIMPPSPDLAWQPEYPDYLWRRTITAERHPAFSYIERVANIAPDIRMDWQGDQKPPVRLVTRLEGLHSRPVEVPISPVVWLAERMDPPDTPTRRPTLLAQDTAAPLSVFQTTAATLAWHALAPMVLRPRTTLVDLPLPVQPVLPPGPETWCIRLAQEAIIPTQLDEEALLLPTFAEEDVLSPRLAAEENC